MATLSFRFASYAVVVHLAFVSAWFKPVYAQSAPDYAKMNKALDAEFVKRRADLPQQLSPILYLINVERFDKGIVFTNRFTTVDPQPTAATKQKVVADMTQRACGDSNMRRMMEWGYSYVWLYLDAKNSYVNRVYVDLSKC